MKNLESFTNLYSKSKTLRFELIPVGKTAEYIEQNGIVETDEKLAESYKKMKKTIDQFHIDFIDRSLSNAELTGLREYYDLYTASAEVKKDEKWNDRFISVKASLRKEIVKCFKEQEWFSAINKNELVKKELVEWLQTQTTELYYDDKFKNFTTYFKGYNQNRMNMYSDEEKATAISYRLINENLPKFIDNLKVYERIKEPLKADLQNLYQALEPWLNGPGWTSLDELFSLESYNKVLTQRQIEVYNLVIGGRKEENGKQKTQGINEYVNLYNQAHRDQKLPKMKMLYKQILSDREATSWIPKAFQNVPELLKSVAVFDKESEILYQELRESIQNLSLCDLERVYLRVSNLHTISTALFGSHQTIDYVLNNYSDVKAIKGHNIQADYLSFSWINQKLDYFAQGVDKSVHTEWTSYTSKSLIDYFTNGFEELYQKEQIARNDANHLLYSEHSEESRLTTDEKSVLKTYLDACMDLLHHIKPLYIPADLELEKDEVFYGDFIPCLEKLQSLTKLYDMVRDFATQKPYNTEKVKINFECSTLLDGWDVNKETSNLGVLFVRDDKYYLGIMNKKHNHTFEKLEVTTDTDCYQKIQYKLLPGPNKMLPKVFFSKKGKEFFRPSEDILKIYTNGTFKKGSNFKLEDCHKLIDFYKANLPKYESWSCFGFRFSPTKDYQDISEFYREVSEQGYQLTYQPVSAEYLDSLVNEGKLYLFQIYNKDFSSYSKGKPNLHTLYWKALFDETNLKDTVYKLNGEAEIFYRKHSIDSKEAVVHPANQPINKKNPVLNGQKSLFSYSIIKDRRYTFDKFQLHVPITMNVKSPNSASINKQVCDYIKNNPDVNIIGIDRGERHLLYLSMIDRNGNVVKDENGNYIQYSLNTITGSYRGADGKPVSFETPYHQLLDQREKQHDQARKSWDTIEGIKDLKAGYMSQVVHHIAKLMVKYNAILVLEDLNSGFKRSRIKVEKQVYQNFEKALLEKLNYLVFKDMPADQPGGLYHALQLTSLFKSFKELSRQSGFIFYVPAWNTSKIDPVTGFVDLLTPRYENVSKAQTFFSKFDRIWYDEAKDWFSFEFDYANFTEKKKLFGKKWTVCTHGDLRYAFNKSANNNKGGIEKHNVTESLKKLFEKFGIDYRKGDLKEQIVNADDKRFFVSLIKNLQITLAMRYSSKEDGKDFILSPVADQNGEFYCSEGRNDGLPQDADANGAFNIARKGLMVLKSIDQAKKDGDWTTRIKNEDWLDFAQNAV